MEKEQNKEEGYVKGLERRKRKDEILRKMEDFITYNLLKYRAEKILSVTNMLVNSIEITKIGSNYRKEVNPIIATISQFDKLIDSIRKRLIADRESKLKFGLESAKVKQTKLK